MTAPSSEATPRPWTIKPAMTPTDGEYDCAIIQDRGVIAECFGRINDNRRENAQANAALIVAAVNSYDESRKLLREAAGLMLVAAATGKDDDMVGQFRRCRDRITAHLEEGQ